VFWGSSERAGASGAFGASAGRESVCSWFARLELDASAGTDLCCSLACALRGSKMHHASRNQNLSFMRTAIWRAAMTFDCLLRSGF
jgi:hypothetical protein